MNQYDWEQKEVIHCPDRKCNGMLLQHSLYYEMKCTNCNEFWIDQIIWHKTINPKK